MIPIIEIGDDKDCDMQSHLNQNEVSIVDGKVYIERIDFPISLTCNLSCKSCTVHSPFLHGQLSTDSLIRSIELWQEKIVPGTVLVLGGEPLLCRDITTVLNNLRHRWPATDIIIVTNGTLLGTMRPYFWEVVKKVDAKISISAHLKDFPKMLHSIENDCPVDVPIECYNFYDYWKSYWEYSSEGFPIVNTFAHTAGESFEMCAVKRCYTVFDQLMYRCNMQFGIAMLRDSNRWHKGLRDIKIETVSVSDTIGKIKMYLTQELYSYPLCGACNTARYLDTVKCEQMR